MNRPCSFALKAMVVGFALFSPALANGRGFRDDQVPYGSEGTIGRGTDYTGDRWSEWSRLSSGGNRFGNIDSNRRGGNGLGSIYSNFSGVFSASHDLTPGNSSAPRADSITATARPYQTNQFYQPGDGYRYPLYYNPATRTYFYYPVRP
jgi:hypothetical protein